MRIWRRAVGGSLLVQRVIWVGGTFVPSYNRSKAGIGTFPTFPRGLSNVRLRQPLTFRAQILKPSAWTKDRDNSNSREHWPPHLIRLRSTQAASEGKIFSRLLAPIAGRLPWKATGNWPPASLSRCRWPIRAGLPGRDAIQFGSDFRGQFQASRCQVLGQMRNAGRAGDQQYVGRTRQQPRQRDLQRARTQACRDAG